MAGARTRAARRADRAGGAPKRGSSASSNVLHWKKTPPVSRGSLKHISGRGRAAMRTSSRCRWAIVASRSSTCRAMECMPPPNRRARIGRRRPLADGLAHLEGVVAHPGHAAASPDARLVGLAVLQHREAHQGGQVAHGEVVVGHHGGGVEQPAHPVAAVPAPPVAVHRAHRPAVTGSSMPVMLRPPGPARNTTASAHVLGIDVAPQRCAGRHARRDCIGALAGAGGDGLDHGVERCAAGEAGRHHIDAHLGAPELLGHRQGRRDHGTLGGGVAGSAGWERPGADGADLHDGAAGVGAHGGRGEPAEFQRPHDVDLEGAPPRAHSPSASGSDSPPAVATLTRMSTTSEAGQRPVHQATARVQVSEVEGDRHTGAPDRLSGRRHRRPWPRAGRRPAPPPRHRRPPAAERRRRPGRCRARRPRRWPP